MVQDTNDIYKLIKSPLYVAQYNSWDGTQVSYILYNTIAPQERITVHYVDDKYMDIYKFNNMNSEYYERISRENKQGKKIAETLFTKREVAMLEFLEERFKASDRLPQR